MDGDMKETVSGRGCFSEHRVCYLRCYTIHIRLYRTSVHGL